MPDWINKISIIKGQKCAGIHINLLSANKYDISMLVLKKTKSTIEVEKTINKLSSIQEITNHITASIPVILSIGGRGIIHKEAEKENGEVNWLQLFPNTQKKDFYSQSFDIADNNSYFSIIRKELVDNILQEFKMHKIFIVDFFLGPVSINQIIPFLNSDKLKIPNYLIDINKDNKLIQNFKYTGSADDNEIDYFIENEKIQSDVLIPYANAISYYIGVENISTDIEKIEFEKKEFIYKQLVSILFFGFLGILFLILLINFILFDTYKNKKNGAAVQLAHNKELINRLEKLQKDLKVKEEIINNADILSSTKWSYYADRIAISLPSKISLTEMVINPLSKKVEPGNEVLFIKNIIEISGKTSSSIYLNDWIKILNQEDWISDIEIINFTQENKYSAGEFSIKVLFNTNSD